MKLLGDVVAEIWTSCKFRILADPDTVCTTEYDSTHLGTNREVILKFHGGTLKTLGGVGCQSFDRIRIEATSDLLLTITG